MRDVYPSDYLTFIEFFNAERYWDSHEVLEGPWRTNRSAFYKGLIIFASAFVHAQRGNPRGVMKQMAKAKRYLNEYRPFYLGLDVDALLDAARACEAVVHAPSPPEGTELERAIPRHKLKLSAERLRGDEPELGR